MIVYLFIQGTTKPIQEAIVLMNKELQGKTK